MKRAIGVVSIGIRPWVGLTYPTVTAYANRVGAKPYILNTPPSNREFPLPPLADSPGRSNKYAYALKAYYPGKLLKDHDQVIILDDTCIVTKETPNLFELFHSGHVAAAPEPHLRGQSVRDQEKQLTLTRLKQFAEKTNEPWIVDRCNCDINSGVMIYDRASLEILNVENIVNARSLLFSQFPHQTLTSYLLARSGLPIQMISEKFNDINIFKEDRKNANPSLTPLGDAYIYHVTGWWKNRHQIIQLLVKRLTDAQRI